MRHFSKLFALDTSLAVDGVGVSMCERLALLAGKLNEFGAPCTPNVDKSGVLDAPTLSSGMMTCKAGYTFVFITQVHTPARDSCWQMRY